MRVEKEIPAVQVWLRGTLSEDMRAEPGDEGHAAVWLRVLTDPVEDMGPIGVRVKADGPSIVWLSVFCQIFVGRFGVSFSPFERLFLGRFGFGQSCGLSVIA